MCNNGCGGRSSDYPYRDDVRITPYRDESQFYPYRDEYSLRNPCNPPRERISERVFYQDIIYRRPIVIRETVREDVRVGPARFVGETPPLPGPPRRY